MNKMDNKNKLKKYMIILGVILLIILGGVMGFKYIKKEKFAEDWLNTYYQYLKENKDSNLIEKNKPKLKFIEVEEQDKPVMVITYQKDGEDYTNVYMIKNKSVKAMILDQPAKVGVFYEVEASKYKYFIINEENVNVAYTSLDKQLERLKDQESMELKPDYTFFKDEEKIEDALIKVDVDEIGYITYDISLNRKDLKIVLEDARDNFKPLEEIIPSDIKKEIENIFPLAYFKDKKQVLYSNGMVEENIDTYQDIPIIMDSDIEEDVIKTFARYFKNTDLDIIKSIKEINYIGEDKQFRFLLDDECDIYVNLEDIKYFNDIIANYNVAKKTMPNKKFTVKFQDKEHMEISNVFEKY